MRRRVIGIHPFHCDNIKTQNEYEQISHFYLNACVNNLQGSCLTQTCLHTRGGLNIQRAQYIALRCSLLANVVMVHIFTILKKVADCSDLFYL